METTHQNPRSQEHFSPSFKLNCNSQFKGEITDKAYEVWVE